MPTKKRSKRVCCSCLNQCYEPKAGDKTLVGYRGRDGKLVKEGVARLVKPLYSSENNMTSSEGEVCSECFQPIYYVKHKWLVEFTDVFGNPFEKIRFVEVEEYD